MTRQPHDQGADLSPAGRARRDDVLTGLQRRLVRRGRVRRAASGLSVCVLAGACITAAAVFFGRSTFTPGGPPSVILAESPSAPVEHAPAQNSPVRITIVSSPGIPLEPCGASPSPEDRMVCIIDDAQLLAVLAETGSEYGLVRRDGRVDVIPFAGE